MPLINRLNPPDDKQECEDIDDIDRPVVVVGARILSKYWEKGEHQHKKAQLIYTTKGIVNCEIDQGVWVVPPQYAIWIPAGVPHTIRGLDINMWYSIFVDADAIEGLPTTCCTLSISPLLRELLTYAAHFPLLYDEQGQEGNIIRVLLDQLVMASVENLHLPMPKDHRLRQLIEGLLANPADKSTLVEWAHRIGMSERSLSRIFSQQVGTSVHRWRRQLHVLIAVERLSKGESVQAVAFDLGYESASSFVTMFRKAQGKPPAKYLSDCGNCATPQYQGLATLV